MGINYSKRLSVLKRQAEDNQTGRLGFFKALFLCVFGMWLFTYIIRSFSTPTADTHNTAFDSDESATNVHERWKKEIQLQFNERIRWLDDSLLVLTPGAGELYYGYGKAVVSIFHTSRQKNSTDAELEIIDFNSWWEAASRAFTNIFLRLGFTAIAFAPLWIIASIVGYYALRKNFRGKKTQDILGFCDRGHGPFYSGIYGPLKSNKSFSGTDYSAPSLACPEMVKPNIALSHKLSTMLKNYGAFSQTNLDLVRVILAYPDFPCYVASEQMAEEDATEEEIVERQNNQQTGFVSNELGTIESSAIEGLAAVLEAHRLLARYITLLQKNNIQSSSLNANYAGHIAEINKLSAQLSPLGKILVNTLTPYRAWSLGQIPISMVASAYLAIEAGKALVYKRQTNGFTRISHFPHLQARAIIHSLVSYHNEYNGDQRLIIRQAIICSRRHGDFGRAFLPMKMPVESRALRDWLEILYTESKKRDTTAYLAELDAHVEEISMNWRSGFTKRLRQDLEQNLNSSPSGSRFWKGLVHKSVVLMPLSELVDIALRGIDEGRLKRMTQLLALSRKFQTSISISARLPGFKRQAVEAQRSGGSLQFLAQTEIEGTSLIERWLIVRRMLTHYNWLSTRVGDDAVPADGFVHGVVTQKVDFTEKTENLRFDALVPLRQRRFEELFGKGWENTYYIDTPHRDNTLVFVDTEQYTEYLKQQPLERDGENRKVSSAG